MLKVLRGRRGFTLAEVMTTVSLIGTLGGGTSFVNPKDKAQQQVCLQHLQVIGQSLAMADIRGDALPKACFFPRSKTAADSLPALMGPNVQAQAWLCPCAPPKLREHKITYVFNSKMGGKMMSEIPNPGSTWLLTDICVVDPKFPAMHNEGANVLYADGQARWVPKAKLPKVR